MLMRIVIWWSAFTMITGAAWNFGSLVLARLLFGVGEAGAFPTTSRSYSRWFPRREIGNAHGVLFMGTRFGGALAPPLVVFLIGLVGWRISFVLFGFLGLVWCLFWWGWYKDDPSEHPGVNAEELEFIRAGRAYNPEKQIHWRELLSFNLFLICMMYFCVGYAFYF